MSATIAMIFTMANQNSVSPKARTVGRFSAISAAMTARAMTGVAQPGRAGSRWRT